MGTHRRAYSKLTSQALERLGKEVRRARKEQRCSEAELAERVGIARSTLQKIERGEPSVAIGVVFEAATVLGLQLFDDDAEGLRRELHRLDRYLALLPKKVRLPAKAVDDDF